VGIDVKDFKLATGQSLLTKEDVKARIREQGIEMIRFEFADIHGINRGKLLPSDMIDEILDYGIPFCASVMALGFDNTVAEAKLLADNNYDDMRAIADPSTFTILSHVEKTALILGDLYYHGEPLKLCPRWFLKGMIARYRELGLAAISASELEFFLFSRTPEGGYTPYTNRANNCYTANSRSDPSGYLYQLTRTFQQMGFKILYMNHEFYPGQYEYNWRHTSTLRSADQTIIFKGVAKDVADQNGLLVTFMAKPKNNNGGSGCHFHLSLNDIETGENAFADPGSEDGMSQVMQHFVAGILKHARALTAFLSPTINCYKRYVPDSFAPCHIAWGRDNRTTFVRIPDEHGPATRVEVRAGSAAANPYLALGGILAAGLDGILNRLEPPAIVATDQYNSRLPQTELVPRSLYRSLNELENDEWMRECAGDELINAFMALKSLEVEAYTRMVTDWEWESYSYHL